MSTLSKSFSKKKALITYITAGDPNLATTEKLVYDLEKAGADIIELGIPFSDPLADGPVIQASHQRALKNNVSLADVFKLVTKLRKRTQIPICFMLSFNLVLKHGIERFYEQAGKAGVDGVIIPDLPPEELPPLSSLRSDFSP
jgi:tryptophan synthase alpha chain